MFNGRAPESVIAYPIDDIPAVTGVTRTQLFEAIRAKELTARKRGRRTIIEVNELRRWIATFPTRGRELIGPCPRCGGNELARAEEGFP
jgi:hypothetical protein